MNRREFLKFTGALTVAAASMYIGLGGILKAKVGESASVLTRVEFHKILKDTFNKHSKVWKMHSMETLRAEDMFGHVIRPVRSRHRRLGSSWLLRRKISPRQPSASC